MILIDTSAIVAFLSHKDSHHAWAVSNINILPIPFLCCEAVLTEALFLASRHPYGPERVFEMFDRNALKMGFSAEEHLPNLHSLMARFSDLPMSFADACLVRMSEIIPDSFVLTMDSHFHIYRRNGRETIPVIMPI